MKGHTVVSKALLLLALGMFVFTGRCQGPPAPPGGSTWVGGAAGSPSSWNTAANWNPAGVPGTGANVTIPASVTYYPVLSTPASNAVQSITINSGATLTINSGGSLITSAGPNSLAVNGSLIMSGGTLTVYRTSPARGASA